MKEITITSDQYLVLINTKDRKLNKDVKLIVKGCVELPESVQALPDMDTTIAGDLYINGNDMDNLKLNCKGTVNISDGANIENLDVTCSSLNVEYSRIKKVKSKSDMTSFMGAQIEETDIVVYSDGMSEIIDCNIHNCKIKSDRLNVSGMIAQEVDFNCNDIFLNELSLEGKKSLQIQKCSDLGLENCNGIGDLNVEAKILDITNSDVTSINLFNVSELQLCGNEHLSYVSSHELLDSIELVNQNLKVLAVPAKRTNINGCNIDDAVISGGIGFITQSKIDSMSLDIDKIEIVQSKINRIKKSRAKNVVAFGLATEINDLECTGKVTIHDSPNANFKAELVKNVEYIEKQPKKLDRSTSPEKKVKEKEDSLPNELFL